MMHCYQNDDGEIIAANSIDEAARYHDCELGGAAEPEDGWRELPDAELVSVREDDGTVATKTAGEWAAEHGKPGYVSTTYS